MNNVNVMQRILVIDDDLDVRESIRDLLASENLGCSVAATGTEGLAKLKAESPDLVVTDIQLPDVSGYQVCQSVKRDAGSRQTRVIMITGRFTEPQDKVQGFESGADEVFTKPFDPKYFIARVKSILRKAA